MNGLAGQTSLFRRSLPRTRCCAGCGWPRCWGPPASTPDRCWTPLAAHRRHGKRGTPRNSGRQRGDAAFKRAAQLDAESFHTLVMRCDALRVRILPFDDPDYPLAFSRIPDMPLVLYCTGDPAGSTSPGRWASWAAASPRNTA